MPPTPLPTPLPEALAGKPFLGADAGISRRTLQGKRFRRLYNDVFVQPVPDSLALRCSGALLVLPKDVAFSQHTAAALRRLPVPESPVLHALVRTGTGVRISGIRAHRGLESADVCPLGDLSVTALDRTFLDLASDLDLENLVVLGAFSAPIGRKA